MDYITKVSIAIAVMSAVLSLIVLVKHLKFKRELVLLKQDMKEHTIKHGVDSGLWSMFVERTRVMLERS